MTKIDYIKANLDLIKFRLSGFLGGFFILLVAMYTEDDVITKIFMGIALIIIGFFLLYLMDKYIQNMEQLKYLD